MTQKIGAVARKVAAPDLDIVARNPAAAPAAIQGPEDGAAAVPHLLTEMRKGVVDGFDAQVICCFDDTGLAEARRLLWPRPVIGIGQSAFHAAALLGCRFSVVTTLPISVPIIEDNLRLYQMHHFCAKVRASGVPVLALDGESEARDAISEQIAAAKFEDGANAVVLGCAGMADLAEEMSAVHGLPVIDGVTAACGLARALLVLQLQ